MRNTLLMADWALNFLKGRLKVENLKEVLQKVRENRVKFVRLQFTDIFGRFKNIAITVEDLEKVFRKQKMFDSSAVAGFAESREHDIVLVPDPDTFVIFPWRPREGAVGRFICDVQNPDGSPYKLCSRSILKKHLNTLEQKGYSYKVGSEIEFFLFTLNNQGEATVKPHDKAGYCDLTPVDLGENARRDMVLTLESMGIDIGSSHHEVAPGQHEIVLKHGNALESADKIVTFKYVVRTIAQRHGLHASFMPKPLKDVNGSALHLHQSIFKDDNNCFFDSSRKWGLSLMALKFIEGIIKHASGISAISNPLVNSYKRLMPSYVAPFYLGWAQHNRNTIIRVPAEGGDNKRIEIRYPDPACNPYLTLSAFLKAGMEGMESDSENIVKPVEDIDYNVFISKRLNEWQDKVLPRNLDDAICALSKDGLMEEVLGSQLMDIYIETKRQEWERFHQEIHQWELREYLAYI